MRVHDRRRAWGSCTMINLPFTASGFEADTASSTACIFSFSAAASKDTCSRGSISAGATSPAPPQAQRMAHLAQRRVQDAHLLHAQLNLTTPSLLHRERERGQASMPRRWRWRWKWRWQWRTFTALATSMVMVPSFGLGMSPRGPKICAERVTNQNAAASSAQQARAHPSNASDQRHHVRSCDAAREVQVALIDLLHQILCPNHSGACQRTARSQAARGTARQDMGAPACRASSALAPRANTATEIFLPVPFGS